LNESIKGEVNLTDLELLEAYRSLWSNRSLHATEEQAREVLIEAIQRDLKDEMTHPRLRKSPYEKFALALKRISDSALSAEAKFLLIRTYVAEAEKLVQLPHA
jgi:hypothetical protein